MEKEIKLTPLYYDYVFGAQYDAVVQIGGRYSGKSYNSEIEEAANLASKEDYKLLIIQDLDKGGSDGYYAGLVDKIEQFEQRPLYSISPSSTKIVNKVNGNTVLFRGYKTDQQKKDVKNIDQVTKIVVEEGEWMTFDDFLALIQQLRGKVRNDRRLDILLNPVNVSCFANKHLVETEPDKVLEYFPDGKRPKVFEKILKVDSQDKSGNHKELEIKILVVLSVHHDNPHLTDIQRASIEIYRETDPEKYRQLGEARFIRPEGAFFKEFDRSIHVIKPFIIPKEWYIYTSMDYGLDKLAGYRIAMDYKGYMYITRGACEKNLIISKAAERMINLTKGDTLALNYGPPDLMKRQQTNGVTTWDMFAEHEWYLSQSDNNRERGSLAMKEWLKVFDRKMEDGTIVKDSRLKIFSNCTDLIETLPEVLTDKNNPNRYATLQNEIDTNVPNYHDLTHDPDAIRYFCVMHNAIPVPGMIQTDYKDAFFNTKKERTNNLCGDIY